MIRFRPSLTLVSAMAILAAPLVQVAGTQIASAYSSDTSYTPGTPNLSTVVNGPWTLSQGDSGQGAPYSLSLPTYTPGGSPTQTGGYPNLSVYPSAAGAGTPPYQTGQVGTPGPLSAYCTSGGALPESGGQAPEPAGTTLPMSPYYFPFVEQTPGDSTQGHLTGFFDYRPKDTEEEIVTATSTDGGNSWTFQGNALDQNPTSYCPTGDTNDNGQGHPYVQTIDGTTYIYTVNRPSGDNVGVGLLIHAINPTASNPLAGLPQTESVGTDADTFASGTVALATTGGGGQTIPVNSLNTGTELVTAGQFEDLNAASPSGSVITCTGTGSSSLTGCTTANGAGLTVNSGDPLVQVLADTISSVTVPAGPNNAGESGGVSISLTAPLNAITSANVPGRFYLDGDTIYCVNISSNSETLENCTTTQAGGFTAASGAGLTTDPIIPADYGQTGGALQTTGLIAPDGIVGVLPSTPAVQAAWGASPGSTVIIYGEKILSYYIEGTTNSQVTLSSTPQSIAITPSTTPTAPIPATGSFNIYLGSTASNTPQTVTCTGYSSDTFTGCTGGSGIVAAGNDVGGPGAAIAPSSVLGSIGEGSSKPKTLFKNNEDLTVLRAASTTNGINFTDLGPLSGTNTAVGSYTDVNNPSTQSYPASQNLAQGATDNPELRYVGTRGTIIVNPDGTIGMFDSGAWESDGDSDAFDQIFYTSSTNGVDWTEPTVVESTDYTFSARQQQDAALAAGHDDPLNISAYFAGRAYSPTVVQNPDGTLTLVFSGYSTPKPVIAVGTTLGDGQGGAPTWTVSANDPALYRSILAVTLTVTPGTGLPESPIALLLPVLAMGIGAAGLFVSIRRRRRNGALV